MQECRQWNGDFIVEDDCVLCRNVGSGMVMQADFESIAPFVTAVSLMTYDFSPPQRYGGTCYSH